MIRGLTLLLLCQLAGEIVVRSLGLVFPGPVLGMFMLLFVLLYFGGPGSDLNALADGILRNLSLLFVPAAVGIIQQVGLLREHWIAVSVALVGSTLLTLLVTVAVFRGVARLLENRS